MGTTTIILICSSVVLALAVILLQVGADRRSKMFNYLLHFVRRWQWRPTWTRLRGWGNNRAIKSSYVWFFVVPMLARFCEQFPDTIKVPLFDATIDLTLRLPFRWTVLFWMSVCFAAGQLLYAMFCPSPIKRFRTFKDYRSQHAGNWLLLNWVEQIPSERFGDLEDRAFPTMTENLASDYFDVCQACHSTRSQWAALASGFLFLLGMILALMLAYQSICDVLKMSGGLPWAPSPTDSI